MAEKFKKNTGKSGGGIGDNKEAGDNGSPDGDPFKNGQGGTGTGGKGGDGVGDGHEDGGGGAVPGDVRDEEAPAAVARRITRTADLTMKCSRIAPQSDAHVRMCQD